MEFIRLAEASVDVVAGTLSTVYQKHGEAPIVWKLANVMHVSKSYK